MNELTRRDFIKLSSILGLSITLPSVLTGCVDEELGDFDGKVLIIGAGAAGMSAGYLLAQRGIDFEILEALDTYGGRFKVNKTFTDFPIPLGAEWLHVDPSIFDEIINDDSVEHDIKLRPYTSDDLEGYYEEGEYSITPATDTDIKFIGSSWFDFYEKYIVPTIRDRMRFDVAVSKIDYLGDQIWLTDVAGNEYAADKVIVTIPLKLLQDGDVVEFIPPLPERKQEAIDEAVVWSGMKIFIEFSEKFFPSALAFPDSDTKEGQRLFYNASIGQNTESKILGVFAVGAQAERYQSLSDQDRLDDILNELDEIFDGIASRTYIKHLTQNWNEEPYARAAYLEDDAPTWISNEMAKSVADKLYFAGASYTSFWDWSSVHTAAQSAREAVDEITEAS